METIYWNTFKTAWGVCYVAESSKGIIRLGLPGSANQTHTELARMDVQLVKKKTELLTKAENQIQEYLVGKRTAFSLPLDLRGTEFQKDVWKTLTNIPYGRTRSYGDIAVLAGNPKAARAVGGSCNRNPVPIIIPCHRVVGSTGELTGFGGGITLKKKLLQLEATS